MRVLGCLLLLACGGAAHPVPATARDYPVTARVPAQFTYLVAFARVDRALRFARDVLRPLGADPDNVDDDLRRALRGLSPLSAADLADAGIALDRGLAVYSTGLLPTLLLPVASREAVVARLERMTSRVTVTVREHRGVQVTLWAPGPEWLGWAVVGDWLVVHGGPARLEPAGTDWLDELLDSRPAEGAEDLGWAAARAGKRRDLLALARVPRLADAGARAECANGWAAKTFGRAAIFGALADGRADLGAVIELAGGVTDELARRTRAPDPALEAARAEAALWLAQGTDPGWLAGFGPADLGAACAGARAARAVIRAGGFLHARLPWLTGGALAVFAALGAADRIEVSALAAVRTRDAGALPKGPSIDLPALAAPVALEAGPGDLRAAIGAGAREHLGAALAGNPREMLALEADLERLPDLDAAARLAWLALTRADDPYHAHALARRVAALRRVRFEALVAREGIDLSLAFELR